MPIATDAMAAERVRKQVEDALELTNFVVKSGVKGADDQPLSFTDIATIQTTAAILGILNVKPDDGGGAPAGSAGSIGMKEWIAFEQAYYRLAIAVSPVTAETLRDTEGSARSASATGDTKQSRFWSRWRNFLFGDSPAQKFTWWFWLFAIVFAVFVVWAESRINIWGLDGDAVAVKWKRDLLESLLPWAYGGLGSCAYLLRSAHYFIYQRTFDMRRKPEYFNRILLGAISGGAIILFVNYLIGENDTVAHLGSAALGFIAGYSTDFLFNTIERIVTAIFPKVSVETVPRDSSQTASRSRTPRRPAQQPPRDPARPEPDPGAANPNP